MKKNIIFGIGGFTLLILLLLQLFSPIKPSALGGYFIYSLASIGVYAEVPPNPINTLAKQLREKELALAQKEKEIEARKDMAAEEHARENTALYYVFGALVVLSLLVAMNFYFDWRHRIKRGS